jgi:hypothetical protein
LNAILILTKKSASYFLVNINFSIHFFHDMFIRISAAVTLLGSGLSLLHISLYLLWIIFLIRWFFRELLSQVLKQFVYTYILLGTNFVILKTQTSSIIICFILSNLMFFEIYFISYNNNPYVCSSLLI